METRSRIGSCFRCLEQICFVKMLYMLFTLLSLRYTIKEFVYAINSLA